MKLIANNIGMTKRDAVAGTMLLMLEGCASRNTPINLEVILPDGKVLSKKNVMGAYLAVTGNTYIRRLAESLAVTTSEFAEFFELKGELVQRINNLLRAKSGETLTKKEAAWCSSFSQNIPDLADRSSERLVKLLAEDYQKRFQKNDSTTKA